MDRSRYGLAVLAAALAAVALAWSAQFTGVLDRVEDEAVGVRFQVRGVEPPRDLAVVAIDDTSFSDLQRQWPFPRSLHGRTIDRLREAGARAIVYDVQFTEPTTEREDRALLKAVERAPGTILATTETDGQGRTNVLGGDDNLAAAGGGCEPGDRAGRPRQAVPARLRPPGQHRRGHGRARDRPRDPARDLRARRDVDRLRRSPGTVPATGP